MNVRFCLVVLVSAGMGLGIAKAIPAHAASNLNSSKSNIYRPISTDADKVACQTVGGNVVVREAKQVCVNPTLPAGWAQKQLPSCETCNSLCPGVCFMHVEGGCICFYDPLRKGG